MQVVVRVTGQEADRLLGRRDRSAGPDAGVGAVAGRAGVTLAPQHPGVRDPDLARWFVAALPDPAAAARLVDELRGMPAVEAAYVKPDEELPAPM